jgi:hypothetical protein
MQLRRISQNGKSLFLGYIAKPHSSKWQIIIFGYMAKPHISKWQIINFELGGFAA